MWRDLGQKLAVQMVEHRSGEQQGRRDAWQVEVKDVKSKVNIKYFLIFCSVRVRLGRDQA
jgi:hypothetical protein